MKKIVLLACLLGLFTIGFNALVFADGTEPTGSGTELDPYQVATLDNLLWISTNSSCWSDNFIQTADIDASATSSWNGGEGWSPIGNISNKFTGSYDGQGYSISNLYIERNSNFQALFGFADGVTIENLGVVDCNITGGQYTSGLIGLVTGTVTNCYSTGLVSGSDYTGGLIGGMNSGSSITESYSTVSVLEGSFVGGLIGKMRESSITDCYATGSVSGSYTVAGLIGCQDDGTVTNCYSTGLVSGSSFLRGLIGYKGGGTVTSCFWDTETSGQSTSAAGTGKTTAEMKTQGTFTGWDFTDTWSISAGYNDGYPYLTDNNTLPVELSTFNAMYNTVSGFVSLNWATASETDVNGFNIYRHTEDSYIEADKINFDLIAGAGTTTQTTEYSFIDETADPYYTTYYYWLEVVNYDGTNDNHGPYTYIPIDVNQDGELSVITSTLSPCFPNPARIGNEIRFSFRVGGLEGTSRNVELKVYNILGKLVATVVDEEMVVNDYTRSWKPQDLSNGVYLYKLRTDSYTETKKMMLVR